MDLNYLKNKTLQVFTDCGIHSFPINCIDILNHYDIKLYSYASLDDELREYCKKLSEDAYSFKDKIFYNDEMPLGRIRFSLMHELAHILLNHGEVHSPHIEQEANYFSSNLLAPRMAIHYSECKNETDVARLFLLTNEAALYALNDYKKWHRQIVYHKMDNFDHAMYSHFYNAIAQKFVYHISHCIYCEKEIINSFEEICNECNYTSNSYSYQQEVNVDYLVAENNWLYGE